MISDTKTAVYRARLKQLTEEQNTWKPHWQEIAEYMLPRKGRYLTSDTDTKANDGSKVHQKIINGSANDALRIIAAGMQGGLTSPARPWFALALPDEELMEYAPVRAWLHTVRQTMLNIFSRSNFYSAIHGIYKELAAFGTSAQIIEEDFRTVIRCRPFTIGEFMIALDDTYRPNVLYRKTSLTVRQLIEAFGKENVSDAVKSALEANQLETRFEVVHAIEPNSAVNPNKSDYRGMAYKSCYFELAGDPQKVLKESGYRTIPFMAPRWEATGTDPYGSSPGMDALGDTKMLQKMEEKKLKALDKMVDPPMNAPTSLRDRGATIVAGGVNFIDAMQGQQSLTPAYMVNPNVQQLGMENERVEQRIRRFFFNDLFLSIISNEKTMTATEIVKRHEEKLMMLGPVLERLQSEMLDPTIERVFDIGNSLRMFPPAPKEIAGMTLDVRYISLLAQAQRMIGTTAIEQTAAFVGNLATADPSVLDKVDFDEAVDQYADMVGVPPKIIRSDDDVAAIREKKQKMQQAQTALAAGQAMADTTKTLADTPVGRTNALDALMGKPPV